MPNQISLQQLIEKEAFIVCPPLETSDFVSYCEKRGLKISKERLEKFEKLGIFAPIARVKFPKLKRKVKYSDDRTTYENLGFLDDGEQWEGEIEEDYYRHFEFSKDMAKEWFEEGLLWEPSSRDFQEWKTFEDMEGIEFIKSYYSIFQIHALYHILQSLTISFQAEELEFYPIEDLQSMINHWAEWTKLTIKSIKENQPHSIWNSTLLTSVLCQVISNRFFPYTQTDRRTITISTFDYYACTPWDWRSYCKSWDANSIKEKLGITNEDIKEIHERLAIDARHIDPLESWYELVGFVSLEEKKRLKDKALLAQSLYSMEHMVRLLYENLTEEKLYPPNEDPTWQLDKYYGEGVMDNELQHLEYLTNKYNLNPKPKLILVVEGYGEEQQIPRLAQELMNISFPRNGIEIINIQGVNNFTGKSRIDKNSALEKFIDYHHNRQTIVFLLFDKEGGIETTIKNLLNAKSKYLDGLSVTKSEYIHLWPKAIEFDNFSDQEIAQAMTKLSENIYTFSAEDVQNYRISGKNNNLNNLYQEKIEHSLSKTELLKILFNYAIENPQIEVDGILQYRPIINVIQKINKLVSINRQPRNLAIKKQNQKSLREEK